MPIARKYSPREILNLLHSCENSRLIPSAAPAHALGTHLYITRNGMQTRVVDEVMEQATKFSTMQDMVGAVYEAFNSAAGQTALARLDAGENRVVVKHTVLGSYDAEGELGEIFVFPMLNNAAERKAMRAGGSLGSLGQKKVRQVTLIVDKQDANTPWIQTAYPSQVI